MYELYICAIYMCYIYMWYIDVDSKMLSNEVWYRCVTYICVMWSYWKIGMSVLCLGRISYVNTKGYGSYIHGCNVYQEKHSMLIIRGSGKELLKLVRDTKWVEEISTRWNLEVNFWIPYSNNQEINK